MQFKKELFKSVENRVCADCKTASSTSGWISCLYFITLCNSCALAHSKLFHRINDYYLIEIEKVYLEFQNTQQKLKNFLKLFSLCGNDKMNSLFEFQIESARSFLLNEGIEAYVLEKYVKKSFVDTKELDLTLNYYEELNKNLSKNVCTPCVSLTIYYMFLGANIYMIDENSKSLLEIANESNQNLQALYLELNECFSSKNVTSLSGSSLIKQLVNYELEGCVEQIFDIKSKIALKENVYVKLISEEIILHRYFKKELKTRIGYLSIIKVFSYTKKHQNNNIVEIKWCNKANNSLISTHLEYNNNFEKQNWLREIFYKMFYNYNTKFSVKDSTDLTGIQNRIISLFDLIKTCQIASMGFLNLMNPIYLDNNSNEQVIVVLLETLQSQWNQYFKRYLIIIKQINFENSILPFYEILDLRKLIRIKLNAESFTIDMPSKTYVFKSNGYLQNLAFWHEKILHMSKIECSTLEEQYLSKDDFPLLIEKCFSCIEMNFISDRKFYFNLIDHSPINLKKVSQFYQRLLKEKDFEFEVKKINPILLLNIVRMFFSNFVQSFHFNIITNTDAKSGSQLMRSSNNSVFFNVFKRLCIHLNIILNFKNYNQINVYDLTTLFGSMLLSNARDISFDFETTLRNFTENCTQAFDLKSDYLQIQYKMAEKSIKLKEISEKQSVASQLLLPESKFLLTIYLFHKHSEQSFQINVDSNFTCKDVLILAQNEFGLCDSKYWSLFEVFDSEQHKMLNESYSTSLNNLILLERLMPISSKLINSLSKWNSFNLVVKTNFIQIDLEKIFLTKGDSFQCPLSFRDDCESLLICENCGFYRTSKVSSCQHETSHKKWIKSSIMVQNANIVIAKKICNKISKNIDSENDMHPSKSSIIFQAPIEDCIFYYGLYEKSTSGISNRQVVYYDSSEDLNRSFSSLSASKYFSGTVSEIFINEEECITFFDSKNTNNCFCVHLESKESALTRYLSLFKLAFCDKWSCFESNHLPVLKSKIPEIPRRPSFLKDFN